MLLTVKLVVPVLAMVSVAVAVAPVVTLPNARLPLSPTIFVGVPAAAMPVPEAAMVPVPLVASLWTVTVPL